MRGQCCDRSPRGVLDARALLAAARSPKATRFFTQCCSRHPMLSGSSEKPRSPGRDCGLFVQNLARTLK